MNTRDESESDPATTEAGSPAITMRDITSRGGAVHADDASGRGIEMDRVDAAKNVVARVEAAVGAPGTVPAGPGASTTIIASQIHAERDVNFAGGNLSITNITTDAPLTAADLDRLLLPGTSPLRRPNAAALLSARHEVVPFFEPGRAGVLAELQGWCNTGAPVRARLLHGAGGMGKTRLLIELCARMRSEGCDPWRAGFLRRDVELAQVHALVAASEVRRTLVVIDYAESRRELARILSDAAAMDDRGRLRIVLLARAVGDWWTFLLERDGLVKDLLTENDPVELRPLVPVGAEREAVFREAGERFAAVLGKPAPTMVPALEDPRFDRVLYLHMAALAAADGRAITATSLMDDTLDHEQRFWTGQFQPKMPLNERLLGEKTRRAVAAFTLRGGAEVGEVEAVVQRASGLDDEGLLTFLRDLYPGTGELHVGGLEPDLLGEAMVLRALTNEGARTGEYLDRVFDGAGERTIGNGFVVLGRLSDERPEAAGWIARVLDRDVAGRAVAAFEAAKTVGERTAHGRLGVVLAAALERKGTVEIARRLEEAGLPDATVSLREVALWVVATRLRGLPDSEEEDVARNRANLLINLGARQSALGLLEAALAATAASVALYRGLTERRPDASLPNLAMGLSNLSGIQHALGLREDALASATEAVAIRRKLVEQLPEAFPNHHLAASLNNLGTMQSDLGMREEALASTIEAVAVSSTLAEQGHGTVLPELAIGLNNLGIGQSELGHREDALASTSKAVAVYRKLAEQHPDAFLPDLAMTLNNLGNTQSELGLREEALASTAEGLAVYRKLAEQRPRTFLPDVAISLNNLGMRQYALGQHEKALTSIAEAIAVYRELAAERLDTFLPDLAMSINNLGMTQGAVGLREEALASATEAVAIRRKLAAQRPDTFLPDLAMSLNNLGTMQSAMGLREEALTSAIEAVAAYCDLAKRLPEAFLHYFAGSLSNLGLRQRALGLCENALASTSQAVALHRTLVEQRPGAFLPDLAMSLNNLGNAQSELGLREEALASTGEAVALHRTLAEQHPDTFLPDLAQSLYNIGNEQNALGKRDAALASMAEAIAIYHKLAEQRPDAFLPNLAETLNNLGATQRDAGDYDSALTSATDALDAIWPGFLRVPQAFARNTSAMIQNILQILEVLGRPPTLELIERMAIFRAKLGV